MALTWAQKKESMRELINAFYAEPLQAAGYVSYKGEGFHWYKVENELLYKVHLPILAPTAPLSLYMGYSAVPLFSWEHIAPTEAFRDFTGDFAECDHFVPCRNELTNALYKKYIGDLPWNPVYTTIESYHLPNGLLIEHEQTKKCGAEKLDSFVFPLLDKLRTVEDVYCWNKTIHNLQNDCLLDSGYIRKMMKRIDKNEFIPNMTLSFADECLYCRDEKLYPVIKHYLKKNMEVKAELEKQFPPKTKELAMENKMSREHADVLLHAMESGNLKLAYAELARQKERMLAQIRKKLPKLKLPEEL